MTRVPAPGLASHTHRGPAGAAAGDRDATRLRSTGSADAEGVAEVLLRSRRAFLPFAPHAHTDDEVRSWVRESLLPAGRVTVLERQGHVIGVLSTSEADDAAWIDQLYLLPGCTGRGLGRVLLDHAHATLGRPVRLYTFQANAGARRFYERHGYRPIRFGDGQDNEERVPDVLYELG